MNIAEQIARFLQPKLPNTAMTTGKLPSSPGRAATVISSDARMAGDEAGARMQVLVRGPDTSTSIPHGDADAVVEALVGFTGMFVQDGSVIVRVLLESGPSQIGLDDAGRQEYSVNFRVFYY